MTADPEPLNGGLANAGAVFRRGRLVERPAPPNASALHAQLRALRSRGFTACPEPIGLLPADPVQHNRTSTDPVPGVPTSGHSAPPAREQLAFIPGEVPQPPFPEWSMTLDALHSVGTLLRRLHDAAASVPLGTAPPGWSRELADPQGGTHLCHNDVCPENVVFRGGRAAALIDFDFAAPGRPLWDIAMTARYWAPVLDPVSASALYPAGLDPARRLRVLADGYGLSPADRAELPAVIEQATSCCRAFVARRVASGDPVYRLAFAEQGGWPRWDRLQSWLAAQREAFTSALLA